MNKAIILIAFINTFLLQVYSKLIVQSPQYIAQQFPKDGMNSTLSNFGMYRYGHTQHGVLIIGAQKKEILSFDSISHDGCTEMENPFHLEGDDLEANKFKTQVPFFLMLDRGNCTFLKKAQNAEKIGAQLLIIADDNEEDLMEEHQLVGTYEAGAQHLHMPTIMISTKDSKILKDAYINMSQEDHHFELINMAFKMNHPKRSKNEVQVELYLNPFESKSIDFLKHYYYIFQSIGEENIKFIPRYHFWYCYSCKKAEKPFQVQDTLRECVSGGRYCVADPDASGSLTGQDVVYQMLRSLCVYKVFGQKLWMKSEIEFHQKCIVYRRSEQDLNECYLDLYESIVIDENSQLSYSERLEREEILEQFQQYKQCYDDSWVKDQFKDQVYWDNKLLAEQRELSQENDVLSTPELIVNGMKFYGDIEEIEATEEFICEAFERENLPLGCRLFDIEWNAIYGNDGEFQEIIQSRFYQILYFLIFTLLIIAVFMWCYKRYMKLNFQRDLQSQVSESVNNYFNIQESSRQ